MGLKNVRQLVKKYNINLKDGLKNAIEEVDNKQCECVCDGELKYLELEKIRVYLYLEYASEYLKNN